MPDDWNKVDIRGGQGGTLREIDLLRKRYADHRATLERLAADSPSERLAAGYAQLIGELDVAVARLQDLDAPFQPEPPPLPPPRWSEAPHRSAATPLGEVRQPPRTGRLIFAVATLLLIAAIGAFTWNWLKDQPEEPDELVTTPLVPEPAIEEAVAGLSITPEVHEYGTLRRGARGARQFEILNNSDTTLPVQVERSACRCLWFEYADTIPPRGTTTLTVTVDASKAPAGTLRETIEVVSRTEPPVSASFEVVAEIER
ncbi:MAG TPA: DUF1573 domain-containing protein [Thermoanaerobaculia bacterium]|nr:DUF1573 domain-containing protein [Thermoanaerobaculia bacterium]